MFDKIFLSPQVKRILIISNNHGIYEFPHELLNDWRPPQGIFAAGGAFVPTQEKKKKDLLSRRSQN